MIQKEDWDRSVTHTCKVFASTAYDFCTRSGRSSLSTLREFLATVACEGFGNGSSKTLWMSESVSYELMEFDWQNSYHRKGMDSAILA